MNTPEAKLLELIKGGGGKKAAPKFRMARSQKALAAALGQAKARLSGLSPWQIANRCLAAALATTLFFGLLSGRKKAERDLFLSPSSEGGREEAAPRRSPASVSLQEMTRRNLFQPLFVAPPPPKVQAVDLPPPPPKIPLSQRAAYLRLTGIIAGDVLQAVIEDRNKGSTRYVSAGEAIDGILVEKVLPDRVILSFEDEKMELPL